MTSALPNVNRKFAIDDLQDSYEKDGRDMAKWPKFDTHCGGFVDIMIGIKYLRYFPKV